ncbi:hypothetical protein DAI22_09g164900 [Oryza sativa Japonica Group]|uniref:Uncharacterized protein n=1 Tax=Oryza nivara TaxID=4536 RepID=A0A0E0IMD5_ORYNI|nr:hypothetical protein DAI22_09g164900 [Oryza sativa Japonica Group]
MSSSVASPSTSPPTTPPSPLPVSVGPGNRRYAFTPSPSPSPPCPSSPAAPKLTPPPHSSSAFSVHARRLARPARPRRFDLGACCLEWILMLLCCCCSSKMRH